ncbi:MAG TPA: ATP-binding protein [Tepidisphaeraceae bacterium]|nr:ATP-binding protein [Tepidisphaeraceae bacterium]
MNAELSHSPLAAAHRIEELGRIIIAYSEVTEKLEQSHGRLKSQVQQLSEELSEKSRLLERKNRLAALGEMAAGMAHEIRNPLGGIQLYASLLAKDVADRSQPLQLVEKISAGVKRIEAIVSQMLQFSREIKISACETNLSHIVEQAVDLVQPHAQLKQINVEVDGPRSMTVKADPIFIGQALLNLLLNAVEAMDQCGNVEVRYFAPPAESDAKQFHLVVRDHGAGISPQILDRIFNPFFTTKDLGTGLGLAIVHRVVEAHDGTIIAANVDGGGAKFEIRI